MSDTTTTPHVRLTLQRGEVVLSHTALVTDERLPAYRLLATAAGFAWDPKAHVFRGALASTPRLLQAMREGAFLAEMDPELQRQAAVLAAEIDAELREGWERMADIRERLAALVPPKRLRRYQEIGVRFLLAHNHCLLADDMGLGKTVQTATAIPVGVPVIVVGTLTTTGVWQDELAKWRPDLRVTRLQGRDCFRWPAPGEVVLINYEVLPPPQRVPAGAPERCVLIGDEIHKASQQSAERTKRFGALQKVISKSGGRAWGLTGTAVQNDPQELWTVLQALGCGREAFGSAQRFLEVYSGTPGPFGSYIWGTPEPEAEDCLKRVMLRRLRKDVLTELPPRIEQIIRVPLEAKQTKQIDTVVAQIRSEGVDIEAELERLRTTNEHVPFAQMSALRAVLAKVKIPMMMQLLDEYVDSGEPVIVFSAHRAPIRQVHERYGWPVVMEGVSDVKRRNIVREFQAGKWQGIGATIKAMSEGATLTRAREVLFVDLAWTGTANSQAEARARRMGQLFAVRVRRLMADHFLDERIMEILVEKMRHEEEVIDASAVGPKARPADVVRDLRSLADQYPEASPRRRARTARERWAAAALRDLAELDTDRATDWNGRGFTRADHHRGHDLADELRRTGRLSGLRWDQALLLACRYQRQVGPPPDSLPRGASL